MIKNKSTSMSVKRIVISLILFAFIPIIKFAVNKLINDQTIAMMFALNITAMILVIYDWELFSLHYNRAKRKVADTIIYSLIGVVVISLWVFINHSFLQGQILVTAEYDIGTSMFNLPCILIGFSFSLAVIVNISFKCITDHIPIHDREFLVILVSGFLFGTLFTLAFVSFKLYILIPTLLYNIILVSILSYLYNQSNTIFPGILSMTIVYLAYQLILFI